MFVINAGDTVEAYAEHYSEVAQRRPKRCPPCGAVDCMTGHGSYPRKKPLLATPAPPRPLRVRRWKCTACKRTTSMLPDILHRYRQYVWAVIGAVLLRRLVLGQTWVQIQRELSALPADAPPAPSLDSMRRWCKALAGHAQDWLQRTLVVLASVQPGLSELNAHGRPVLTLAQQLLQAAAPFAQWLAQASARRAPDPTVADLRAVWRWGWNDGLGRLI